MNTMLDYPAKKQSRKEAEDTVSVWRQRLVRSFRAKEPEVKKWRMVNAMYHLEHYSGVADFDRVVVGKLFSNLRQMVSALYFQNPTMYAKPLTPMGEWTGPIMEQVLNRVRKVIDAEGQERHTLTNALLYGTGILKHGYHAEFCGPYTPIADPKAPSKDEKPAPSGNEGGDELWGDMTLPASALTEHNDLIQFDQPWKRAISPFDFYVDPEAKTPNEARWFAHEIHRPWLDVRRDIRYDAKARKELDPTGPSAWFDTEKHNFDKWRDGDLNATDAAMCTLYEIYDKTTGLVTTIAEGCPIPLGVKPYPYRQGPYTILQFFPSDRSFWAISYAWTFMTQVQALDKLRSRMLQHFDAWGRTKAATSRQYVDEEEAKAWANQPDNSVLFLNNPDGKKLQEIFDVFPHIPVPSDAYNLTELFERDLDEISGISELARGSAKNVQTATEATYIQQQQGLRVADMRYQLERCITDSDRKIMDILVDFWDSSRVIPIVGPDGINWDYVTVARDVLPGGFEIEIEPGSTERVDKNVRTRQAIDMMAQLTPMAQWLQMQGFGINWAELVKVLLKNTEIIRNPDRILYQLQPTPSPQGGAVNPAAAVSGPAFFQNQAGAPLNLTMQGQAPWESDAGVSGRTQSEAFGGRAPVAV